MEKPSKTIKIVNKNIIIITLVGTFITSTTPIEVFTEVEDDILYNKINVETMINKENIFEER